MADPHSATAEGAPAGESTAPAKKGGIASFLPLLIAIIAMPGVAYLTLEVKSRFFDKKPAGGAAAPESHEKGSESPKEAAPADHGAASSAGSAHGGSAKGKGTTKVDKRNTNLAVPLTRAIIKYAGPASAQDVEKIVTLDVKGEMKDIAESDKIVVNIANTGGARYAVARFSMLGDAADLIDRLNEHRVKLISSVQGALSSETLEDFGRPGFKNLLAAALVAQFNAILGPGTVKEVIIEELVIQ